MKIRILTRSLCRFSSVGRIDRGVLHFNKIETNFGIRTVCSTSRSGFDDYDRERATWNVSIQDRFNFASDVIDVWARKEKDGVRDATIPAFWHVSETGGEVKWNFQMLERETKRVANMLQNQCGVKQGDNIIVMLPKIPEFWLVNVAAIRLGAVLSPASMMLTTKDLAYRFSVFAPACIIAHESVIDLIDEFKGSAGADGFKKAIFYRVSGVCSSLKTKIIVSDSKVNDNRKRGWRDFHQLQETAAEDHKCAETRSDDSMAVFFTSGTTGHPKMAEHTHGSYGIGHSTTGRYWLDLTSENILWAISDTGWAKTAYAIFAPWYCGSGLFVHKMPRFSAPLLLQVLSKFPIDTLCSPPLVYRAMLQENLTKHKFAKLSHCLSAGEHLDPEIAKKWEAATGLRLYEGYGQTETVMVTAMFKSIEYRLGSIGKPQPAMDVVILDENENELGPGFTGEIAVKKRNGRIFGLFKGYRNDSEKTKKSLTEKYFHMGDVGYYDEDGYFWFVGRNDDLINSAGYRIGPSEVESALMEHPAVAEAAVTSSPDVDRGEVVKAFIVLTGAYNNTPQSELIKELQEHTKRITAPYKYPRKIEFIEELPKTSSGKIKRFELKQREWKKV